LEVAYLITTARTPILTNCGPSPDFFQKEGYERNPVTSHNNVVAKLLVATNAKMDTEVKLQGAKDLAAVFP